MPDGLGKIPPWGWALGAVGAGAAFYLYKKSKEKKAEEVSSESASETSGEVPVAYSLPEAELPYGYGGGGAAGLGGAIGGAAESQQEFHELFGQQQTFEKEFAQQQQESQRSIAEQIKQSEEAISRILQESVKGPAQGTTVASGSGGGAPSSPAPGGTTTVQPPAGQSPSCPSAFPEHNAARGPVGPNSCWRWSRTKTGGGCACHGYQSGALECQTGKAPNCKW